MELAENVPPAPLRGALVGQHWDRLAAQVAEKEMARVAHAAAAGGEKDTATRRFARAAARARNELADFLRLSSAPPEGMRTAVVYHAPAAHAGKGGGVDPVRREYLKSLGRLRQYVAANHAEELRALGVSDRGIAQMKARREARNAEGRTLDMDADHIIESEGSGAWALRRGVDPDDPGGGEKFLVNFFGNFTFLRGREHKGKNRLKRVQMPTKGARAAAQWYLSWVTVRGPGQSGFVAKPQEGGLPPRSMGPVQRLQYIAFCAWQAGEALYRIRSGLAAETGRRRVDLSAAFNGAAQSPVVREQAKVLRAALEEAARQAETAFRETSRDRHIPKQERLYARFRASWRNSAMKKLRATAAAVDFLPEGAGLLAAFRGIDARAAALPKPPPRRKKKRAARRRGP